jgi:hypothetical protein
MMTYILLRNNKENGPLSLDQIRNMGLRANDLVWVEGQSVCWLNPGEIKELKEHVGREAATPVAKEPLKKPQEAVYQQPILQDEPIKEKIVEPVIIEKKEPVVSNDLDRYMPRKETVKVQEEEEFPTYKVDEQTEIVFPNKQGVYKVKEKEVVPETKYAKPLEEIKEMYVKSLEQRMKKKTFQFYIPPQVKKIAIYAGILIAGLIVGLLISNKGDSKDTLAHEKSVPANAETTVPVTDVAQNPSVQDSFVVNDPLPYQPEAEDRMVAQNETRGIKDREMETRNDPPATEPVKTISASEPVVEKQSKMEDEPKTKELTLKEMRAFVSVSSNDYVVGSFGGIKNLELTVTNTSKFILDHVVVELKYLKPRDELLKSEHISFYSIGANDSKTIAIPKSTRGVKVSYKIIRVESKDISSNTAGL